MEMVELPQREKVTLKAKRCKSLWIFVEQLLTSTAAAKSKGNSKPTASYILSTTLPAPYRSSAIIAPSLIGSEEDEATYIGICTVLVSYIAMSPGEVVPEPRLIRALRRLNIEGNTPLGKTDAILKKMGAQGYIWKVTDRQGDEETIDYRLGPRGRTEIGKMGVRGFVKEIYGDNAPDDLDKKLNRSLNMDIASIEQVSRAAEEEEPEEHNGGHSRRVSGRRGRAAANDEDDE